ncbi:MAG: hypothetical protein Q7O66_20680 [Dehalococcoidia bacterium]|nr:hypothetical protein [Dehalococcoidia bacterium]
MKRERDIEPEYGRMRLPRIILPAYKPPTEEELALRRSAIEEILRIRSEIGLVGRSVTDLIREDRDSH